MGDFDSDLKWLLFAPIITVVLLTFLNTNPSWFALGNTSQSTTQVVLADCQSYKSQIEQQQAKIEQLDKDLSDCKNQNPSGFTIWDFLLGFIMGAGIVVLWIYQQEKKRKEEANWNKMSQSLSKTKGRRRK